MEEPPLIRHWHSCVIVNSQMYIWGGKYGGDHLSDIYCLDLGNVKLRKKKIKIIMIRTNKTKEDSL